MGLRTRIALAVLLAVVVAVLALRDTPAEHAAPGDDRDRDEWRASAAAGYPMEIAFGDDGLRLEARPERILPCNASAVDYLVSLVEPGRVLGLPHTALAYATLDGPNPGWDALPSLDDYSSEAILDLAPDLVVTHAWQNQAAMATLQAAGVPVLRLPETKSYEDLRNLLRVLGRALDAEDRSRALIEEYDGRVAALRADTSRSGWTALSYSNYGTGGWTAR